MPDLSPDEFLGYTVVRLGHVLALRFETELATHGLTPSRFGVLAHLAADPGLGSGQLARLVMITPQSMGALLDELERDGLVRRGPAIRGRLRATEVTAAGRERLRAAVPAVVALEAKSTAVLGEARSHATNESLHLLLERYAGRG